MTANDYIGAYNQYFDPFPRNMNCAYLSRSGRRISNDSENS